MTEQTAPKPASWTDIPLVPCPAGNACPDVENCTLHHPDDEVELRYQVFEANGAAGELWPTMAAATAGMIEFDRDEPFGPGEIIKDLATGRKMKATQFLATFR